MVAGLTAGRPRYASVDQEMRSAAARSAELATELLALAGRDATAIAELIAAIRAPRAVGIAGPTRRAAVERAIILATEAPLEIARAAADLAALAADAAERGHAMAVADAAVAAVLADAVCRAAGLIVRVNATALLDAGAGLRFTEEATRFAQAATVALARATAAAGQPR